MSEVSAQSAAASNATDDLAADLLDTLAGIAPESPLAALRQQRAEIARYIQGSYDALLEPADEAGLSRIERGLMALRVAMLERSAPLTDHYRAYLAQHNAPAATVAAVEKGSSGELAPRLHALIAHVDRLTHEPRAATPEHLQELKAQGLTDANIVSLSQLIAFVSFQVRALVGLQLLGEGL